MKNGRNALWRKKKPLFGKYSNSTYQFNLTWKTLKRTHVPLQPERQPGCSWSHQPGRGKGRSATEPQQATPTKRISPPKTSSRATTPEFALARCLAARAPRPSCPFGVRSAAGRTGSCSMAEGFGRWESDPLFPAAECVQDSADRYGLRSPCCLLLPWSACCLAPESHARLVVLPSWDSWP